jgi:Helix-turn-helix of DDE superfamily endonuclease/DDE superfamily endonuclease
MYNTTGLCSREIQELCALITEIQSSIPSPCGPPGVAADPGPGNSVVVALTYLRRNRVQCELAETYAVSQSTISRAISTVTPLLARALARFVPVAEELVPGRQYIVDGTLLPCWSWATHPRLYSGKHKTTGMNVQVVYTLDGGLVWISDPIEGAHHDVF